MKECPSCHSTIQSQILMCPSCGHSFDSSSEIDGAQEVKRTMMGIPGIELRPVASSTQEAPEEASRKTMFGFPVNELISEAVNLDEGTNSYEESATQIVDADQFMLDEALSNTPQDAPRFVERPNAQMRSTITGGLPSLASMSQEMEESSGVDDEDESVRTMVASASTFQFDGAADEVKTSEPDDVQPKLHSRPKKHETLMGMSLEDLAPEHAKRTLFSIPTHDAGDGLSEFSEDESDAEEDIPTQAISGAIFAKEPVEDSTREQNRQRLLDKLRANNKSSDEDRPARHTMFGIPAVSSDSSIYEDDLDERSAHLTPHTGVLKIAKRSQLSEPSDSSIEKSSTGVLGSSSYMLNKDVSEGEEVGPSLKEQEQKPLPSINLSRSLRDKLNAASSPKSSGSTLSSARSEPSIVDQESTRVVSDIVLGDLPGFDETASDAQEDLFRAEEDMTREQNISDLHMQLRRSAEHEAVPRQHFSDDATRQHDLSSIREQLGDQLFALTPSEASEGDDATAVAPSLADVVEPRSNTGPLFAMAHATPSEALQAEEPDFLAPDVELPEVEFEALPELDVLPVDPLPEFNVPAPVMPSVDPEPMHLPMIDAEPLPVEPAYKTVTSTSTPTPPRGTQLPTQVAAQSTPTRQGDVGRLFQVVFALLGMICFVCATILPVAGVVTMPGDGAISPLIYAPLMLGVMSLLGAVLPISGARQALLILASLFGIGLFVAGLLLTLPILLSILSLVGALFSLTAILFPIFARSM